MWVRIGLEWTTEQKVKELGEFVNVHELVHILTPSHGKVFKSFMQAYLPDWEEREIKLHEFVGREAF